MSGTLLMVERVAVLRHVEFFNRAPGHVLASVAAQAEEMSFAPGGSIIRVGEPGDSLFIVVRGTIRVTVDDTYTNDLGVGSVVGELAVLVPERRSASVDSVDHSLLLRLRKSVVDELLLDHPDVAMGVITTLVKRFQGGGHAASGARVGNVGPVDGV